MQTTSLRVPIDIKSMAQMMKMSEFEVRYFPYAEELRRIIKDYNYNMYNKNMFIEKLETIRKACTGNNTIYAQGMVELVQTIRYNY